MQYKKVTITRDQLPLPGEYVANIKCRGFKQVKQFDLHEGLSYCFVPPKLDLMQEAHYMNLPTSNDTDLLAHFTQTNNNCVDNTDNTENDFQNDTTSNTATAATTSQSQ
jgi:hypothetical protein